MAKVNIIQTSFTQGELSDNMNARIDLEAYKTSAKTIENAYPIIQGGLKKRPGSRFISGVHDATRPVKMIGYTYSRKQSYVLILNGGRIQFIKNREFIMNGASRYEISLPYTDAELDEVRYAQSGNIMFFVHPNHPPKQLTRNSDTNWVLNDMVFYYDALSDQWYRTGYLDFKIISASKDFGVGDEFTFSTDGNGNVASGPTFSDAGGGTGDQNGIKGTISGIKINPITDALTSTGELWHVKCVEAAKNRWVFSVNGSVSGTPIAGWSVNNYPQSVSFYDQRLIFGGSPKFPQHIWGSVVGEYYNFTNGPLDSDAFTFQIASDNFDQIVHLSNARQLLPLTASGEFSVFGGAVSGITPSAVKIQSHTFHGASDIRPVRLAQEVLFVQRDHRKIRALSYEVNIDGNVAPDLTILADHISETGIKDMAFAQTPDYILWMPRFDGQLISLAHIRQHNTTAFARHTTQGKYLNVVSIPEELDDITYVCVERELNGATQKYIEYFDYKNDVYSDSAYVFESATKVSTINNLSHLNGATVKILADGKVHKDLVVNGGTINLTFPAKKVIIGLPYSVKIELLHPQIVLPDGTSQGREISIHEVVVKVKNTLGMKVDKILHPVMKTNVLMDSPPDKYNGDVKIKIIGWKSPKHLLIEQDLPMDFQCQGLVLKLQVSND